MDWSGQSGFDQTRNLLLIFYFNPPKCENITLEYHIS